jgi:hypothetical protein
MRRGRRAAALNCGNTIAVAVGPSG